MSFSSSLFLFLFVPLFFTAYYLTPSFKKNTTLLIGSMLFYAWGEPLFFPMLILSVAADYFLSKRIAQVRVSQKKFYLICSVLLNAGTLVYYKYTNFFLKSFYDAIDLTSSIFANATNHPFTPFDIVMPLGISFITFQKLSYILDVYSGKSEPPNKIGILLTYVFLFPQILSGPITRYREIVHEIANERTVTYTQRVEGIFRFGVGLAKKILIANPLGSQADLIFAVDPSLLTLEQAWWGSLCYTFQIYFDFAGYSDMAIGLGRMLGFNIPENFDSPYISKNITDFWRRWHITLGRWMRDYLYIPLGGNRRGMFRTYLNLWIVFLISGLWHGASWNFIAWGAFHGLFLVLDRIFDAERGSLLPVTLRIFMTFLFANFGWVLFRSPDLVYALKMWRAMFTAPAAPLALADPRSVSLFAFAILFSFLPAIPSVKRWAEEIVIPSNIRWILWAQSFAVLTLILWSVGEIASSDFAPFIYFRF